MKYEIIPGVGYSTENTQTRIRIKRVRMYSEWIFRLRVRAHVMCMHSESKNPLRIHAHTFYAYSCLRVFSRITHPWLLAGLKKLFHERYPLWHAVTNFKK